MQKYMGFSLLHPSQSLEAASVTVIVIDDNKDEEEDNDDDDDELDIVHKKIF